MTHINIIENKISSVEKYLKILEGYKKYSVDEINNDLTLKGAVERYLYLVSQATIELADAIVSLKDLRKPTVYSEVFDILREEGLISGKLAEQLIKMTGFRNVVAHDYEKVNFDIIYEVLQNKLGDIEEFIKEIKNKLKI